MPHIRGHIIGKGELQTDLVALKCGGKRRKRIGRADPGYGGAIECFRAGLLRDHEFRNAALPVDNELDQDLPAAPHARALRDNGHPVTPDRGQDHNQIRLEIDALGIAQQLEIAADAPGRGSLAEIGNGREIVADVADGCSSSAALSGGSARGVLNGSLGQRNL